MSQNAYCATFFLFFLILFFSFGDSDINKNHRGGGGDVERYDAEKFLTIYNHHRKKHFKVKHSDYVAYKGGVVFNAEKKELFFRGGYRLLRCKGLIAPLSIFLLFYIALALDMNQSHNQYKHILYSLILLHLFH